MKKWLIAFAVALLVLGCWTSAAAEILWFCDVCLEPTVWVHTNYGEYHHSECSVCGDGYDSPHRIDCTDMTKCAECGTTTNLEDCPIDHPAITEYLDADYHVTSCPCGDVYQKTAHYEDGYCIESHDETTHRISCLCSWDVYKFEAHTAYCSKDPTTCVECDETGVTVELKHYISGYVWFDEKTHQEACRDCDYAGELVPHVIFCWKPDYCYSCMSENVESKLPEELIHFEEYNVTATTHQMYCISCDVEFDAEPHTFRGNVCTVCDYDKSSTPLPLPGDADGNSRVTLNDAIAILEGTVSNDANADVNGDGKTDLNDALRILQYLAGWNVSLQ